VKCLWCLTGGEYLLAESMEVLKRQSGATVAVSTAGLEVVSMYGLLDELKGAADDIVLEGTHGRSAPIIMMLRSYDVVVVAPCSANTAAKIAHGIADSLVTNIVSQALKSCVKVVVLPTDAEPEVTGKTVSGKDVRIRCRRVDLENVERLKQEMVVVRNKTELENALS